MKSIEDLEVFLLAKELGIDIYRITKNFPKEEIFGLTSQMRRAAVSICSNLAEGGSRISGGELKQFVGIARGSAGELKFQLMFANDLGYVGENNFMSIKQKADRVHKMLTGLLKTI